MSPLAARGDVSWGDKLITDAHTAQQSFSIDRPTGAVPATVWTPVGRPGPFPLVLLGHGGSGHRHSQRIVTMAARFAAAGYAAAAIDGPFHGERVPSPLPPAEYQARIAAEGIGVILDRMADEWVATSGVLADAAIADRTRVAYVGLSMGTRFGLSVAVALGPELRCAVFGKFGVESAPALNPALHAPDRARRDASRITAPVLFHMQWDDDVFPRTGQLDLFDAFASRDKELHAFAGRHNHTPPYAPDLWHSFVQRHLAVR